MKYILAVGIIYQKYKNPMEVTIESKKFIDSFTIDEDIGYKDHHEARLEPNDWCEECRTCTERCDVQHIDVSFMRCYRLCKERDLGDQPYTQIPKKFYFYEIDDDALGEKILINFDCEDNNYTNGFMTKTSLFKLRMIGILPKTFLEYYYKIKGKHRFFERLKERSVRKVQHELGNSVWPYNRKNWLWSSPNSNLDKKYLNNDREPAWLGGKIQLEIPIIKKFGVKMFDPYSVKKHGFVLSNMFVYKSIFEKYYKLNIINEDQ